MSIERDYCFERSLDRHSANINGGQPDHGTAIAGHSRRRPRSRELIDRSKRGNCTALQTPPSIEPIRITAGRRVCMYRSPVPSNEMQALRGGSVTAGPPLFRSAGRGLASAFASNEAVREDTVVGGCSVPEICTEITVPITLQSNVEPLEVDCQCT